MLFDPGLCEVIEAGIVARDGLAAGDRLGGPAIVTERETTVVIPVGFSAMVRDDGSIEVVREDME